MTCRFRGGNENRRTDRSAAHRSLSSSLALLPPSSSPLTLATPRRPIIALSLVNFSRSNLSMI